MIAREAGISPSKLSEHRVGDQDLYLAAYELAMSGVLERARTAGEREQHWSGQIRASLRALLDELAASPELARACAAVEHSTPGGAAEAPRSAVLARLGPMLAPASAEPAAGALEEVDYRVLADGVLDTIGRTVRASSPAALPSLLVQLHWWAVALRCV